VLIIEKAEFLIKLNVSKTIIQREQVHKLEKQKSKQQKRKEELDHLENHFQKKSLIDSPQRKLYQGDDVYREAPIMKQATLSRPDVSKEALEQWMDMYNLKDSIQHMNEKKEQFFESSANSILACLQMSVTTQKIKDQVETAFLKGIKRSCGLSLIGYFMDLELPYRMMQDLMNWFCSSLRNNQNKVVHYLDDISGCGEYLETKCKENFFKIIKSLLNELLESEEEQQILDILKSLHWKYTARDHQDIYGLQIFHHIHQGNKNKKLNKVQLSWGVHL